MQEVTSFLTYRWHPKKGPLTEWGPNSLVDATWNYAGELQDWIVRFPVSASFKRNTDVFYRHALISETGWNPYQSSMAVRTADFGKLSPCLKALTPVLQKSEVDYFANPAAARRTNSPRAAYVIVLPLGPSISAGRSPRPAAPART